MDRAGLEKLLQASIHGIEILLVVMDAIYGFEPGDIFREAFRKGEIRCKNRNDVLPCLDRIGQLIP